MNPQVKITVTDGREINLELYPDKAPITVENFLKLVEDNYYQNVIFHRIIPNFMIQSGGYYIKDKTILEKPTTNTIKGEFTSNNHQNDLTHDLGVISMARTQIKDSASSQFFICSANSPHLDGEYAAFGKALDEESIKVVVDLSFSKTVKMDHFDDFPYPIIEISNITIVN